MNQFFQELRTGFEIGKLPKMLLKVEILIFAELEKCTIFFSRSEQYIFAC